MADHQLTGILLVGGASSRFGSSKALARFEGETLAERAWRLLAEVCVERIAVGRSGGLPFPALAGLDMARVELEERLLANVNTPADLATLAP